MSNADELMVSEKTAHNYLNAGLFDADKMDCPRIIRMRPRRSTPKLKIDRHCYEGRTYEDFMRFIADNPDVPLRSDGLCHWKQEWESPFDYVFPEHQSASCFPA